MKMLLTVMLSAFIIISGIVVYVVYLNHISNTFIICVNTITKSAEENNWELAKENTEQLWDKWNKEKKILAAFTDHGDLDEVEKSICELRESVMHQNIETTARFASVLQILMERLKENEYPSWSNILKNAQFRHNMHNML